MRKEKNIFLLFLILLISISVGFVLFSFTQVDLSLTLSQQTIFQSIQKEFQHIGFYQRPLSTLIYLCLLILFTGLYVGILIAVKKNILKERNLTILIATIVLIFFVTYPAAFSYDIFNYIFTAKTVLLYHQNPYVVKPLDFQGIDIMLSFMRWTHLASAYTPFWIGLSLLPYLLSFGTLLISLWTMKLVPLLFYGICIWSIGRILTITNPKLRLLGIAAFAFNPLVIIEVLVSAHNDIVMMAFALLAYEYFLKKDVYKSFLFFALSVAAKFITIFLLPLYLLKWSARKSVFLLLCALSFVILRREFLPWYYLWIIPFVSLIPENSPVLILSTGMSIGLLLKYAPIFYFGSYDPPSVFLQNLAIIGSVLVSILVAYVIRRKNRVLSGK